MTTPLWVRVLANVLEPAGYCVITTSGLQALQRARRSEVSIRIQRGEFDRDVRQRADAIRRTPP